MPIRNTATTYGSVSKFFHWLIAGLVVLMLCIGASFSYLPDGAFFSFLMKVHKSIGLTILGLMVLRLLWRLVNPTPRLPHNTPNWEHVAIRWTHGLLYATVIAIPITGVVMSLSGGHPVQFWWLYNVHIAWIPKDEALSHIMHDLHAYLAWTISVLLCIHIIAALKHHFINKDDILTRMMPEKKRDHFH